MKIQLVKTKKNLKTIYDIICDNITSSIFIKLGFNFFNHLVQNNKIHIYFVKTHKKISAVITVINYKNYQSITYDILFHLILNPHKIILNFFELKDSIKKSSKLKLNSKYLHLLHLIIFKNNFLSISVKKKDIIFDNIFKNILTEHDAKTLFLCFEKENISAKKYYKRNNFKNFHKMKNIIYLKKYFKI